MRAQKSGSYRYRVCITQGSGYPQRLSLVLQHQAVAGFNFNRGHAFSQQCPQTRRALFKQLNLACGTCGRNGSCNTAARFGNVFITRTVQALLELTCPVAAMHQVRVAIN